LYTDGVTEAMASNREQFGLERLAALVKENAELPAEQLCSAINTRVLAWCNQAADDDITLLIARYREV